MAEAQYRSLGCGTSDKKNGDRSSPAVRRFGFLGMFEEPTEKVREDSVDLYCGRGCMFYVALNRNTERTREPGRSFMETGPSHQSNGHEVLSPKARITA